MYREHAARLEAKTMTHSSRHTPSHAAEGTPAPDSEAARRVEELQRRVEGLEKALRHTDHTNAELRSELADIRHLLHAGINAAADTVLIVDVVGTILAINESGALRFQSTPAELVNTNVFDHMHPNLVTDRRRWLKEAIETRKPLQFKDRHRGITYGHRLYPSVEPHSNALRIAVVSRDITESEGALKGLRDSEARYRAILEDQTELICRYLPDGRLSYVNEAYARFFNKDRRELINTNYIPHIPDEDLDLIREKLGRLSREAPVASFEHRVILESGDVRWQHWVHRAIYDQEGNLLEFQAVGHSIDKRKMAQEALVESERRFRTLFEESPISLWEEDFSLVKEHFDGLRKAGVNNFREYFDFHPEEVNNCAAMVGVLDVNRASLQFLEATSKLDLLKGLSSAFTGNSLKIFKEELIALAEGERVFQSEMEHGTFSGRIKHAVVHLVVAPGYEDTLGRVIVSLIDVTERTKAEELLNDNRAFLHQVIDTVPSPIFVKDRSGAFVLVNKAMAEMYGTTVTEMVDKRGSDFNPHEDETHLFQVEDQEVLDSQKAIFIPQRVVTHADGSQRWYSTTKLPLKGKDQLLGVAMDITERKHAESERRELERHFRQSQKMQALGTLAGGIAHDFNNMIFAILGFVRLARKKAEPNTKLMDYLDQIQSAGIRASELVRQILTFSRQTEQEKQPVPLVPLTSEVGKMLRATLPATIEMRVNISSELGLDQDTTLGDPSQIHQVLMNLCTNAAHAMNEQGGTLTLSLAPREITPDEAKTLVGQGSGSFLEISVSDTGHGIDPAIMEQIFDPFFTTKAPGEGTGMGLSVAHGIVRSHGGVIRARSEPGQGATFTVLLPRLIEGAQSVEPPEASVPGGSEHILFVDDESMIVDMVQELLTNLGYQVTALTSPLEALDKIQHDPQGFDLVLTDQTMPDLLGTELARHATALNSNLPVVLLTGYSQSLAQDNGGDADQHGEAQDVSPEDSGIVEVIMKPVVEEQLGRIIRHVLDQRMDQRMEQSKKGKHHGQTALG